MYHMYHLTFTQCFTCFRKKTGFSKCDFMEFHLRWLCHFSILVFNSGKKGKRKQEKFVGGEIQYSSRYSIAYIQNTYFYLSLDETTAMQISAFEIFNSVLKFFTEILMGNLPQKTLHSLHSLHSIEESLVQNILQIHLQSLTASNVNLGI